MTSEDTDTKAFNRQDFDDFLVRTRCVGLSGPYVLSSGIQTPYHIKFKKLLSKRHFGTFADFVASFIKDQGIDTSDSYFIGVPLGANHLAQKLSETIGNGNLAEARKDPLERAEDPIDRYFSGNVETGDNVIYIEDVVTTGRNLNLYVDRAKEKGVDLNVNYAIAICDRMEEAGTTPLSLAAGKTGLIAEYQAITPNELLARSGIELKALTNIETLLPKAIAATCPNDIPLIREVIKYYANYGSQFNAYKKDVFVEEFSRAGDFNMAVTFPSASIRTRDKTNNIILRGCVDEGLLTLENWEKGK